MQTDKESIEALRNSIRESALALLSFRADLLQDFVTLALLTLRFLTAGRLLAGSDDVGPPSRLPYAAACMIWTAGIPAGPHGRTGGTTACCDACGPSALLAARTDSNALSIKCSRLLAEQQPVGVRFANLYTHSPFSFVKRLHSKGGIKELTCAFALLLYKESFAR